MNLFCMISSWVWPAVSGIALGLGYSATFSWGLAKATARGAHDEIPELLPQDVNTNTKEVRTSKTIAKQAYTLVSISLVRFILTAGILVGIGQLTADANASIVAQTGWACVGLVVGLLLFIAITIIWGKNTHSPTP